MTPGTPVPSYPWPGLSLSLLFPLALNSAENREKQRRRGGEGEGGGGALLGRVCCECVKCSSGTGACVMAMRVGVD